MMARDHRIARQRGIRRPKDLQKPKWPSDEEFRKGTEPPDVGTNNQPESTSCWQVIQLVFSTSWQTNLLKFLNISTVVFWFTNLALSLEPWASTALRETHGNQTSTQKIKSMANPSVTLQVSEQQNCIYFMHHVLNCLNKGFILKK